MNCLKDFGVEERIWWTQYGFKSGSGIVDVLLCVRGVIDQNINVSRRFLMIVLD